MNSDNDLCGMVTLRVQQWQEYLGSNQWLSNWTYSSLNKKQIMFGTGNIANYSVLVEVMIIGREATTTTLHIP